MKGPSAGTRGWRGESWSPARGPSPSSWPLPRPHRDGAARGAQSLCRKLPVYLKKGRFLPSTKFLSGFSRTTHPPALWGEGHVEGSKRMPSNSAALTKRASQLTPSSSRALRLSPLSRWLLCRGWTSQQRGRARSGDPPVVRAAVLSLSPCFLFRVRAAGLPDEELWSQSRGAPPDRPPGALRLGRPDGLKA